MAIKCEATACIHLIGTIATDHVFVIQDFPYYVEEGISHDNIWCTTPLSTEQLIQVTHPSVAFVYCCNLKFVT